MKTTQKIAAILSAIALAVPSVAAVKEKKRTYISGEVGVVTFQLLKDACNAAGVSCQDSGVVWGLSGGYWFSDHFAAELGGRYGTVEPVSGVDLDFTSFSVGGRFRSSADYGFIFTGKAGWHFWDAKVSSRFASESDDGSDPYFGLGIGFNAEEYGVYSLEYTRFQADDEDADAITIHAHWYF